jgi:hypothetical protein
MLWLNSWHVDVLLASYNLLSSVAVSKCSQSEKHKRKFHGRKQNNKIVECTRLAGVENAEPIAGKSWLRLINVMFLRITITVYLYGCHILRQ